MTDAAFIYYWSPWSFFLIFCLVVGLGGLGWGTYKRRELRKKSEARWAIAVFGSGFFVVLGMLLMMGRLTETASPRVVIHRDYMWCASWNHNGQHLQVPWRSFTGVSYEKSQSQGAWLFMEYDVLFRLDSRYLNEIPWTDWVRSNQRVRCDASGLTDNPRRLSFPTDSFEIYKQIETAWSAAIWQWPRR